MARFHSRVHAVLSGLGLAGAWTTFSGGTARRLACLPGSLLYIPAVAAAHLVCLSTCLSGTSLSATGKAAANCEMASLCSEPRQRTKPSGEVCFDLENVL